MTLWLTNKPSKTQKRRGPTLRARRRSPGPHSGAGRVRRPDVMPFSAQRPTRGCPLRLESLLGLLEKVCGRKTERNGEKQNKTQEAAKLPCRLASEKKASEEYQENPKNARGPEWHPAKTPERKDARPKRENKPNAAGTQTRKGRKTQSACGGVPCDYLIFLSEKRKRKKKKQKKRRRRRNNQRRKEGNPKTPDLTSREFFKTVSGAKNQKIKQKHRQNSTKKHKTNTDTQKQKFAPENFSRKRPLDEKNDKKRQKTPDQGQKTQNEKNGQHFPLREGGKNQTQAPYSV